jgi:hypothetical protein
MIKTLLLFIMSVLNLNYFLYAQNNDDDIVYYSVKSCDPYKWNFTLDLSPANLGLGYMDSYFGLELMSEIRFRKIFSLYFVYQQPWWSNKSTGGKKYWSIVYNKWHKLAYNLSSNDVSDLETCNILQPFYYIEIGGGINLTDKINNVKTEVTLYEKKEKNYLGSTYDTWGKNDQFFKLKEDCG